MNALLPLAALLIVGSGSVAGFVAYEVSDVAHPKHGCASYPLHETDGRGLIRFQITNEASTARNVNVCALTPRLENIAQKTVLIPAGETVTVDLPVPPGSYFAQHDFQDGPLSARGSARVYLRECPHLATRVDGRVSDYGIGSDGTGGCFDPGSGAPTLSWIEFALSWLGSGRAEIRAAGVGGSTSLAAALLVSFRVPLHFGFLLFTRLRRPEVLEHARRNDIHGLVDAEPGIHANAIAKRLGIARGETLYHLHVLVHQRILSRVENWGLRSFFVAGRFPPAEMRAKAALRSEPMNRLYDVIRRQDDATLSEIARSAGFSVGRASRIARRLEQVGLVTRVERGRAVHYYPSAPFPPSGPVAS